MMQPRPQFRDTRWVIWLCCSCWCLLLLSASASASASASGVSHDGRSLYYNRYGSYPEYCSDPAAMERRAIPPLPVAKDTADPQSKLERVTAIVRHGARTPIHSKNCWKGHWDEPDGIWDCELATLLSTRPYDEARDNADDQGRFVVKKIYDAFWGEKVPSPYRNTMNGTCQDGQLIQQGYDQHRKNGQLLREAYVSDDSSGTADPERDRRLVLLTTSSLRQARDTGRFLEDFVRYRSDDDQRTLASGQILLSSMFGPEAVEYREAHNGRAPVVAHHTADIQNDILSSKRGTDICPKQKEIMERGVESEAYRNFFHSNESHVIRQLIDDELEPEGVHFGGLDCMMTSMCTDRSIPEVISDYQTTVDNTSPYTEKYGPNRFERLMNYVIQNMTFTSRFNDSELSKEDMGPLWAEILDSKETFSLFSGHDSTIYPLMTSLGEKIWNATNFPAYASMMLIEYHEILNTTNATEFPSGKAFRLIYDGNVLTWLVDGCPEYSHLCDLSIFLNRVKPFATRKHHGCGFEESANNNDSENNSSDDPENNASTTPGIATHVRFELIDSSEDWQILIVAMSSSFVFGSLVTCIVMLCCRYRPSRKRRQKYRRDNESPLASGFSHEDNEPDVTIT